MNRLVFFLFALILVACGDKNGSTPKVPDGQSTDDAIALLPSAPLAVATVDGRAFFSSQTFGAELAKFIEKLLPIGQESGFQASRDVDRVTLGVYTASGIDVSAVVIGRFDEAKIKATAANKTPVKGGMLVQSSYLNHDIYTVSNIGFTLLSNERALVGTEGGIRRVLERIKDGRVKRDVPAWMIQTLETPSAAAAAAIDLATNPMPPEVARIIPAQAYQGLKAVRSVATFKDKGVQIATSGTYVDEAAATAGAGYVKQAGPLLKLASVIGVQVTQFDVTNEKSDVSVKLATDDQSLKNVLVLAPGWIK